MSINSVTLYGRVGKDAEVRMAGQSKVATFSLCTGGKYKTSDGRELDDTAWHNIVAWRKLAELAEKYVDKGSQLYVEGRIKTEKFKGNDGTDKYVTRIVASTLQLLGSKKDSQSAPQSPAPQQKPKTTPLPTIDNSDGSDDLPW